MRPGHHEERVGPTTEHRNSIHAPRNPKLARNSGAQTFCDAPKRCNSNDAISKLEICVGELRATFLRNHSSVPHSGVVLPNRCNACGALLPRLFLLSGGNCYHRAATRRRHAGDTPATRRHGGPMVVKPPDECWVVRWVVGVVLNVQSTSAGCAEKGVFGAKWTTL